MSGVLPTSEIEAALQKLPGWTLRDNALESNFQFPDFVAAMRFVNAVADAAEALNHHPDITIQYNKVALTLSSHDSGGITQRDLRLAAKINEIVSS